MKRLVRACGRLTLTSTLIVVVLLSASGCFLLPNDPPLPVLQANPLTGEAPLTVHFSAIGSTDPDGIVLAYIWSFGDGNSGSGQTTDHTFNVAGTYAVQLVIEDNDGAEAGLTVTVVVEASNASPSAAFSFQPSPAVQAAPVQFDASTSSDLDGLIVAYSWDFGDGAVGTGPLVEHVFPEPGLRTVTLTVTDNQGATQQRSLAVVVSETAEQQALVALFVPKSSSIDVGETVQLDATSSTAATGGISSYAWSFGDGFSAGGATVGHAYSAAGTYQVTLTVSDAVGGSAQTTGTITVVAATPTPPAEPPETPPETPPATPPEAPPSDGEGIYQRSFSWWYQGHSWSMSLSIQQELYDHAASRTRNAWPNRSYGNYILDPYDDSLLDAILDDCWFDCYFSTIKNAFAFVQGAIADQADGGAFAYPQYPVETLVNGTGDSEDTAILCASLIRTMGYRSLLAAVDTDGDGIADQMIALVPVGNNFARYGIPEAWRYSGMNYAIAATGTGTSRLGSDPWRLSSADFKMLWDASRLDSTPNLVKQ